MAKAVLSIEDKEEGVGITYKVELTPVPKTKEELTMAQNIGLTMFDAVESMLNRYGAKVTRGDAPGPQG